MNSQRSMNIIITGAARGIGRGLTRSLLQRGHRIYLIDNNRSELDHTLSQCIQWSTSTNSAGRDRFKGRLVDLADRAEISTAVDEASAFFEGHLDVLVNNAFASPHTWTPSGTVMESNSEAIMSQWDIKLAVGLTAPFYLSKLCIPMLTKLSRISSSPSSAPDPPCVGSIINISSTRAHQAEDDHELYSTVKAGLLGLTRSMAVSLGHRHKIRVNAISPGWISVDNENIEADKNGISWEDRISAADHEWHPAGRVGKVDDVVKAVLFLSKSEFVTGEEIILDGGVSRKMYYPE